MTDRPFKNIYSKTLRVDMCYYPDNGEVYTEDGGHYTHQEYKSLKGMPAEEIRDIHTVKRIFNGKILPPGA